MAKFICSWHHNTESSSFWIDHIIRAETDREAAEKLLDQVDIEKHTKPYDRRLRVRVYGPITGNFEEFYVSHSVKVERK